VFPDGGDDRVHRGLRGDVGVAVGSHDALVDHPGDFDLDARLVGEHGVQRLLLRTSAPVRSTRLMP